MSSIGTALDVGCKYPLRLIELIHKFNVNKCIGVDMDSEEEIVNASHSGISDETSLLKSYQLSLLIEDKDYKKTFHNAYKLYTVLALEKSPMAFEELDTRLEILYKTSIQEYLNSPRDEFDVIIASKVLSHIDEDNWYKVASDLIDMLSVKGIIFFRLNSYSFNIPDKVEKANNDFYIPSNIVHLFDENKIKRITNLLQDVKIREDNSQNNKKVIEIVGRKKLKPQAILKV